MILAIDTTPGLLSSGLLCPCCSFLAVGIALSYWAIAGFWLADYPASLKQKSIVAVSAGIVVLTFVLWASFVPSRVALWIVRKDFESLLENAPKDGWDRPKMRAQWIGCFHVSEYYADANGGVYFRTASHADGLGPDSMSYGFAFRPNTAGCPFGRKGYTTIWLFGDWYWFSVSDD